MEMVRVIAKHDAEVNKATQTLGSRRYVPRCKDTEIVELLLEHRADASKGKTEVGATPLFVASDFQRLHVAQLLLTRKTIVTITSHQMVPRMPKNANVVWKLLFTIFRSV